MERINQVRAREILDSRGFPTVEAEVTTVSGHLGRAAVPSGASTGSREALEWRDKDPARYNGRGVQQTVAHVHELIAPVLEGQTLESQAQWDQQLLELDGTDNKSRLGANAVLAVSLAFAHVAAAAKQQPLFLHLAEKRDDFALPVPMMNILNGGAHADNTVDIQEFMIIPVAASSFSDALMQGAAVFHALKALLKQRGLSTAVGDEGGFAPDLPSNEAALELIMEAVQHAGLRAGEDIVFALDVAASELYRDQHYHLASEGKALVAADFLAYLQRWADAYPIISIEDAMAEDDWAGWALLTRDMGARLQLVGDDIFVTNPRLLQRGIEQNVANSILIKPNQIGTLTETQTAIALAEQAGYSAVMSHRSGETEDTTIADLAVGLGVHQIKTGSLCRADRTAKYNQLLRIEQMLGAKAHYAGQEAFLCMK